MRPLALLLVCLLLAVPAHGASPDGVVSALRAEVDATVAAHPEQAGRIDTAAWPEDARQQMLLVEAAAQQVGRLRVAVAFGIEPGAQRLPWSPQEGRDAAAAWLEAESAWARSDLAATAAPSPDGLREGVYRAWAPTTALLHIPFAMNRIDKDPHLDLTDPDQVLDLLGPAAAAHVLADHLPAAGPAGAAVPADRLAAIAAAVPEEVSVSLDRDVAVPWRSAAEAQARGAAMESLVWTLQAYHAHVYGRHADPGREDGDDPVAVAAGLSLQMVDGVHGGRLAAEMLADWNAKRERLPPRAQETVAAQILAWAAVDATLDGQVPVGEPPADRASPLLAPAALFLAVLASAWRQRTAMPGRREMAHPVQRF